MKSKKYSLNKKDMKDVGVMALVTGVGAVALFFVDSVLPHLDFGKYTPLIAPFVPIVTYAVKKFVQGK